MAHGGAPVSNISSGSAAGARVCVVTTRWNEEVCEQMRSRAVAVATEAGAEVVEAHVMGAIELPVVVQQAARQFDAVVALGCVIRGGTPHFDYVCDSVTQGLTRVSLDESTPVANGVLTVNSQEQALARAGFPDSIEDKGGEAMTAALDTLATLRILREQQLSNEQEQA
ncbi:6,7-dimethyl-8-ribityllumazine synthase [Corynebacterium propinquum]|uniref:6,7-dimethyl-8-ribityllumazine synthase n=1 Tax=Corynebacterium propinquum TaxID=43769 RepID=A0ABT7FZB6_9CORY|nr:6,7-dimethyl-8-ribityllumazine synthase [Corynebacterium propinquum]MDK4238007.1 6,7-dimethyl-8-ribityllumazine synthase [Corynebacterium propinquum]MDK4299740.1 6,7-dimethyl-8-ribityllumazine synthase [Corynebacterium propinquum]MDK4312467.1 6,7-dimethyl-8-ribityllumazine synthase [Corynebacterium propinquum]RUP80443.1 6,7-dimethyl-8-ribityllumazine synthase [Corynebacterium propinquum]RUP90667.1 6,7-dimethyl-8-ribityllumazine synthase [Corynebacterium propinquum]